MRFTGTANSILLVAGLLLAGLPLGAACTVTRSPGSTTYTSVHEALDSITSPSDKVIGHVIRVEGICEDDYAVIGSFKNLRLEGAGSPGPHGIKAPVGYSAAVVNITDSFNVRVEGLLLNGNGTASIIGVGSSQQVEVAKTALLNGTTGLSCRNGSYCIVDRISDGSTFTNLTGAAVTAESGSLIDFEPGITPTTLATISSTKGGIHVFGNSQVIAYGSWNMSLASASPDGLSVGIWVVGSRFDFRGPCGARSYISGGDRGIRVQESGNINYPCLLTIQGTKMAVEIAHSSAANLGGATGALTIQNNTDPANPRIPGGLVVTDGSVADLKGALISGNQLAGVYTRNNGMITLTGNTITGNLGDGVLVTQRSTVWLDHRTAPANSINGNSGKDLSCTVQGTAFGDASGIATKAKLDCKTFEALP